MRKTFGRPKKALPAQESNATMGPASRPSEAPPAMDASTKSTAPAGSEPVAAPPAKRRGTFPAVLWTVGLIAVAAGAIGAARPFWFPKLEEGLRAAAQDPRVVEIDDRLKALEDSVRTSAGAATQNLEAERGRLTERLTILMERINALESTSQSLRKMVSATVPPADAQRAEIALRELYQRLSELEQDSQKIEPLSQRVARLEESDTTVVKREAELRALGGRSEKINGLVDVLGARLDDLEKTTGAGVADSRAETVVLAVGQLREALKFSAPFTYELHALNAVAGDGSAVAGALKFLRPHAEKGIPTLEELRERFDKVASDIARAKIKLEGEGWIARAVNQLAALVSIRRVGDAAVFEGVEGAVARAEASLKRGDLNASISEVEALDGADVKTAAPWLAAARARLGAEQAMAKVHVHAISLLSRPDR